jgi:RNA polymerase sigma-70 factor (ECF subfamily)
MTSAHDLSLELPAGAGRDAAVEQEALFERVAAEFAAPLARLARAHEADLSLRQDLLQEIHIALWRSLANFGNRCSLRTWVYRVAHNVAASHVLRDRRRPKPVLATLDEIDVPFDAPDPADSIYQALVMRQLTELIQKLKPLDRQVIILHLEGLPAEEIAEITGISSTNTNTKLTRIRQLLAAQFNAGETP